ncbi:predicted protein [Histoplasma capsulatum var. duboisii H88]|uniref:Predicted protein n=1 Tax=Ajellomyces capsulatus (strain H88) TaxID=544711 RepID=F0UKR2_AJEC8|nr:predicted protein [Histoplasma capsulatum var. duboisii H88]
MPFTQRVKTRPVLRIELGSLTTWIRGPQEVQSAWSHYCHSSSAIQVMKWFQVPDPATECLGKGNGEQRDTRTRFSHMGLRWSVVRESLGSAHQHSLGGMTQSVMICAKEGYDLRIMQMTLLEKKNIPSWCTLFLLFQPSVSSVRRISPNLGDSGLALTWKR